MRKLYLTVLVAPLFSVSSYGDEFVRDEKGWAVGCPYVSATLVANDGYPGGQTMISIQPDTVEVKEGCLFVINNPGGHNISTDGGSTTWLDGAVTSGNLMLGPADSGQGLFKYKITVENIGALDPRARVL